MARCQTLFCPRWPWGHTPSDPTEATVTESRTLRLDPPSWRVDNSLYLPRTGDSLYPEPSSPASPYTAPRHIAKPWHQHPTGIARASARPSLLSPGPVQSRTGSQVLALWESWSGTPHLSHCREGTCWLLCATRRLRAPERPQKQMTRLGRMAQAPPISGVAPTPAQSLSDHPRIPHKPSQHHSLS